MSCWQKEGRRLVCVRAHQNVPVRPLPLVVWALVRREANDDNIAEEHEVHQSIEPEAPVGHRCRSVARFCKQRHLKRRENCLRRNREAERWARALERERESEASVLARVPAEALPCLPKT